MSLTIHVTCLVACGVFYPAQFIGAAPEPLRTTGIALVSTSANGKVEYFDGEEGASGPATASPASAATAPAGAVGPATTLPTEQELELDPTGVLSRATSTPGSAEIPGGGLSGDPLALAGGPGGGQGQGVRGNPGQVTTGVFGVQGKGTKFVYVFDRSGSMAGYEGRPLAASKSQLLRSLKDLTSVNQFQIVFYNNSPQIFHIRGNSPALAFGDESSKDRADRFVRGVIAQGGTSHLPALKVGLALQPDVIFFLTDADEPKMTPDELAQVKRANKGTAIHCIEFGYGSPTSELNFIKRIAAENGGQYVYVDVSKLP